MSPWSALAVVAAGLGAGFVNVIVGSGSLITFPTLVALGVPPVLANVSNTVGIAPGSASGVVAYRRELAGQGRRLVVLGTAATAGAVLGGVALLALPGSVFRAVVPFLILAAVALMAAQPRLARWMAHRRRHPGHGSGVLVAAVGLVGVYGGYFGAAQGVILIALLAVFVDDHLQRLNAAKNVLAMLANVVAGLLFVAVTHVDWAVAGLIALGSVAGGQLGASVGRRLPVPVLRAVIMAVGLVVAVLLAVEWH